MNKDFTHRLYALDACLRNRLRKWDSEALLKQINRQLEEKYGIKVARRTLFSDLKYLQEEASAPIEKYKEGSRVFYRYSESDYSIKNLPLRGEDVGFLKEAIQMLRQVGNFSIIDDVEAIVAKLEHTIAAGDAQQTAIFFERHSVADGAHYLDDLLQAIKGKMPLEIAYQPFSTPAPERWIIHPYLLKEYRARWFLIGRREGTVTITTLALDRIRSLKPAKLAFVENDLFQPDTFYDHLIGVSLPEGEVVQEIFIHIAGKQCHYIRTKPIHHSQEIVEENLSRDRMIIRLHLIDNYELRSTLMSYGPDIKVLSPEGLRAKMADLFEKGYKCYL